MKTILVLSLVVATLILCHAQGFGQTTTMTPAATAAQPSAGSGFAAGLLSEEGEGDLAAAAAAYRQTIQAFDRQRDEAANAIFRLGEVYRKLGRMEEAKVQYARILREFPDMIPLTELSHSLLFGDEAQSIGSGGGGFGSGGGTGGGGGSIGAGGMPRAGAATTNVSEVRAEERAQYIDAAMARPADPRDPERIMMQRYGITGSGAVRESSAPEAANRITCVNNLKQLGLAARIYATDHNGAFPREVGLMSNEMHVTKVLVCPSDTSHEPAASWDEFRAPLHMTYEYAGVLAWVDQPQTVLFRCPIHGHVTLGDGSVQQGQSQQSAVTPQPNEILRRRYGLVDAAPKQVPSVEDTLNVINNNLRKIDGAKQQWALENRKPESAEPTETDIGFYLRDGFPTSTAGERYEINAVGQEVSAVLTQPIGPHQAGERVIICPATVMQITITQDGSLLVKGGPLVDGIPHVRGSASRMDLDGVSQLIKQMPDETRAVRLIELQADPETDFSRIVAVLDACQEAGISPIKLGTEPRAAIGQELERLNAEAQSLQREADLNAQNLRRLSSEESRFESELQQATTQQSRSRQKLEAARRFAPERLPAIVSQDERYQRLKSEYEAAVLSGDEPEQVRTRARLKSWVENIYQPELEAEVELADLERSRVLKRSDELELGRSSLKVQGPQKGNQLYELNKRIGQLQSLLDRTQEDQRAEGR